MRKLTLATMLLIGIATSGQECNCEENFDWVKKTFEENDAGFQIVLDKKGMSEYEKHNRVYLEKAKKSSSLAECSELLYDWLTFFRNGHISINIHQANTTNPAGKTDLTADRKWETINMTEKQLQKYLSNVRQDSFEGIWKMDPYVIGVVKKGTEYVGFILEAPGTAWKKNHVKLRFSPKEGQTGHSGKLFLRNYSEYPLENVSLLGHNFIQMGNFSMQRINPVVEDPKSLKSYLELMKTKDPIMQEYSENTLVLRIPSFDGAQKKAIDSLLNIYHDKIVSTENLVIDIRNNGGGSDSSYSKIISYLYTNPIRIVGLEMLSTPLNNQRMESFLNAPDISEEEKTRLQADLKKLDDNLGKFVNLYGEKVFLQTLEKVYEYPKNVAVLTNESNGSTAEQFLLAAKQSSKTKLFGKTTMGVLDISNMHFVTSPCGKIEMGYCLSKSYRIPHMAIDDKGIQPDYFMDDTIPDSEWIQHIETVWQTAK